MKKLLIGILLLLIVAVPRMGFAQTSPTPVPATIPGPLLTTSFQVAISGQAWVTSLTVGDNTTVSWLLGYDNSGNGNVNQLLVSATLPPGHTLVPGSVTWFDGNHPNGEPISDTEMFIQEQGLGIVGARSNGYVKYKTRTANVVCGNTYKPLARFNADNIVVTHDVTITTPACPASPPLTQSPPPTPPVQPSAPVAPVQPTPPAPTAPTEPSEPPLPTQTETSRRQTTTRRQAVAGDSTKKANTLVKTGIDGTFLPLIVTVIATAGAYAWQYFRRSFWWELCLQLKKYYTA